MAIAPQPVAADNDPNRVYPSPMVGWGAMIIIWIMVTLAMLDRGIIALMVDPMKQDLGLTDVQIGMLQGFAFALLYCLGSVPMGYLGDKYSRRWIFYLGVSIWSAATALCGLANNFVQLFLARLGVGLGEATLAPSSFAMIPDLFPPHRHAVMIGILAAASTAGGSISFILGGFVVEWAHDMAPAWNIAPWQIVFLVAGVPGVLLAPLIFLIPKLVDRRAVADTRADLPGYGAWLKSNIFYILMLIFAVGFHAVVATGIAAWTPAYMSRHFHLPPREIGLTFGPLLGICGFMGGSLSGWLMDTLHGRGIRNVHMLYLIVNGLAMTVLGVTAFLLVDSYGLFLFFLALLVTIMPVSGIALAHLAMVTPGIYRGRTTAVYMLGMSLISMILGPISVAYISEHIFGGPQFVGQSLATVLVIFPLLSVVACLVGLKPAARALAARAG